LSSTELQDLNNVAQDKYNQKKAQADIYGITTSTFYDTLTKVDSSKLFVTNTTYTVYTPNGTAVPVLKRGELLTATQKQEINNHVSTYYPNATKLREPTTNYNCHSYAWYSQSSSNIYWMDNPNAYMTDGSYSYTSNPVANNKVWYNSGGHSGIIYSRASGPIGPNAYGTITETSKWGAWGLYRHGAMYCPYYSSGLSLSFYS
jgi:hypothetical protein